MVKISSSVFSTRLYHFAFKKNIKTNFRISLHAKPPGKTPRELLQGYEKNFLHVLFSGLRI